MAGTGDLGGRSESIIVWSLRRGNADIGVVGDLDARNDPFIKDWSLRRGNDDKSWPDLISGQATIVALASESRVVSSLESIRLSS